MAEANKTVDLVSKDGERTWSSNDPVEITNLRAQGWRDKPAAEAAPAADKAAAPKPTK